jgi:hypothetical protein
MRAGFDRRLARSFRPSLTVVEQSHPPEVDLQLAKVP